MAHNTQILILLGPNGAGKTTIGRMLANRFGGQFLSIEEFFMARYATLEDYRANREAAYEAFEDYVRQAVGETVVIFEEVGLSDVSRFMIENLWNDYRVVLVMVMADEATCLRRVAARGTNHNFPKTPESVIWVRDAFLKQTHYGFDLEVYNEDLSEDEMYQMFEPFIVSA